MSDLDTAFDTAANSKNPVDDPQGDAPLELRAHHQQARHGDNRAPEPTATEGVEHGKCTAWTGLADMDRDRAKAQYVTLLGAIG